MIKNIVHLFIISYILGCKPNNENEQVINQINSLESDEIEVKVNQAKYETFYHEIVSNGLVSAKKIIELSFKNPGIIKKIYVKNGDKVKQGDLISELFDDEWITEEKKALIDYKTAQLDYSDFLLKMGIDTNVNSNKVKEQIEIAKIRSGLIRAELNYENSKKNRKNTKLLAPFSGKIINLNSNAFQSQKAEQNICSLIDEINLSVDFQILEKELYSVQLNTPIVIIPLSNPSQKYNGTVSFINPMIDESGMIKVTAKITNSAGLLSGMKVKILILKDKGKQILIPKKAVLDRQDSKIVFTLKNNKAVWNYVKIVGENSNYYAIESEIQQGDSVIYEGNFNLAHDKKVKPVN